MGKKDAYEFFGTLDDILELIKKFASCSYSSLNARLKGIYN